jgi:anti-sigma B factor antagonist
VECEKASLRNKAISPARFGELEVIVTPFASGEDAAHEHSVVVPVADEIDHDNAHQLRRQLDAALETGALRIVVDMTDLTFIDSSGLAEIVRVATILGPRGRLVLRHPSPIVQRVVAITGLDDVFDIEH